MIEVLVILKPHGKDVGARVLGLCKIWNDGTGTFENGNYDLTLSKFGGKGVWKKGRVEYLSRKKQGPWDLLFQALRSVVGGRNTSVRPLPELIDAVNNLPYNDLGKLLDVIKARVNGEKNADKET